GLDLGVLFCLLVGGLRLLRELLGLLALAGGLLEAGGLLLVKLVRLLQPLGPGRLLAVGLAAFAVRRLLPILGGLGGGVALVLVARLLLALLRLDLLHVLAEAAQVVGLLAALFGQALGLLALLLAVSRAGFQFCPRAFRGLDLARLEPVGVVGEQFLHLDQPGDG